MNTLLMDFYSLFYWITVADGVKQTLDAFSNWFLAFTIGFGIAYVIAFCCSLSDYDDQDDLVSAKFWRKYFGRIFFWSFTIMTILWISWAFVPSKKDALIIVAGGAVGNFVTQDSTARGIPADVMKLLSTKIKEEINETTLKDAIQGETDTLKGKTKEELIEQIRNMK